MEAISLFAGAGGCSLGFLRSGVNILAAFDNFEPAIRTYNKNFRGNKCHNLDLSICDFQQVRNELGLKRGELDLIMGGPPCQGFTTAGNRFWDDPRNKLVRNYVQALEHFYPRWFMMENVEGILTTAGGQYIFECLKKMIDLGYSVSLEKVYMQEYGIPQRRKRVFIVGNREGKRFSFPTPIKYATGAIFRNGSSTLRDVIADLQSVSLPDIDHCPREECDVQLERIKALKVGQSMQNLPENLQHDSFKRRSLRRVCDGTPSKKRGGAPSGLKRLSYDEPCLTITSASTSEFVHPVENRTLTLRECARIQTFPDDFMFEGTEMQKALQIGNAIPPKMGAHIAEQILKCDQNQILAEPAGLVQYSVTKAGAMSPALAKTCIALDTLLIGNYQQMKKGD